MSSPSALQRTVRRCTAVVVIAIGVAAGSVGSSRPLGPLVLSTVAAIFLLASLVYTPTWDVADE
ncbi:MAG: hypothetical protein ABEI27_06500 [Halobellus sp.]|uniref:hypothetical protein n=1 Tax=Halobellus sp. TaxID=1979212 RepID=UPI0035D4B2A8